MQLTLELFLGTTPGHRSARPARLANLSDLTNNKVYKLTNVSLPLHFQSEKDVASWLRSGIVGQPTYDAATKEIVAAKKNTSDVTSQVGAKIVYCCTLT